MNIKNLKRAEELSKTIRQINKDIELTKITKKIHINIDSKNNNYTGHRVGHIDIKLAKAFLLEKLEEKKQILLKEIEDL